jgi:hypothetical protein
MILFKQSWTFYYSLINSSDFGLWKENPGIEYNDASEA